MSDARLLRISRELFLAAFGIQQQSADSWVIDRLTSLLEEEEVQAGQALWRLGEPLEFLYFMQNGSVRMTRAGARPLTFQGRWVLGGFQAHLERPLTRDATALTDFQAMKIRPSAWLELLEDSFFLARSNVQLSAAAVSGLEERLPRGLQTAAALPRPTPTALHSASSVIERLAFLAEVEMLRGAGVQPLAELAVSASVVNCESGAPLFEALAAHGRIVVVVVGQVRATHRESAATWYYGPWDIVCGAGSFAGAPGWDVIATTATCALSFPTELWFELMDEHFDLMRTALAALAVRREALLDSLAEQSDGFVLG